MRKAHESGNGLIRLRPYIMEGMELLMVLSTLL